MQAWHEALQALVKLDGGRMRDIDTALNALAYLGELACRLDKVVIH